MPPTEVPSEASKSLDERIREVELRVIARDENARRRLDAIGHKLTRLPRPRDLLVPLAGAVAAGGALVWGWRRFVRDGRSHERGAPGFVRSRASAESDSGSARARGGLPWVQLIGLAWPLVPARWRSRVDPSLLGTALAVGLPWLQAALVRHQEPSGPPVRAVGPLDLARYAGTWYEVARLPAPFEALCKGQPTATYALEADGSVGVVNRCCTVGAHEVSSEGVARAVAGGEGSQLEVSLFPSWLRWLPFAWADYWVLAIDTDYRRALVGDPKRRFLWVLSRTPHMSDAELDELLAIAQRQGYDLADLKINSVR